MKTKPTRTRFRATLVACCALLLLALPPAPASSEEDGEKRPRIVKKIRIQCPDDEPCEEHEGVYEVDVERLPGGRHGFAWMSGEGPGHFAHGMLGGGFLGVQLAELTPDLRAHFGVGESAGVMISKVLDDSPAARAGVEVGDIVTAVDGERITSGWKLQRVIRGKKDGEPVLLEVWRNGSVQNLPAAIEERPADPRETAWSFVMDCDDDDDENCSFARRSLGHPGHRGRFFELDCEGDEPCEVQIRCDDDGDCECTANGEPAECDGSPIGEH